MESSLAPLASQSLAVVTPMADEADNAARFIGEVLVASTPFARTRHFVVLDRVSTEATRRIVEELAAGDSRVEAIWSPENRSVVDAYRRGYRAALDGGFNWVLEIDAGFSHQPEELARFLPHAAAGADCVFGSRRLLPGSVTETPRLRRLISTGGTMVANLVLGTKLTDMTSGYQLFRAPVLRAILERGIRSRAHFFQTEMKFHARRARVVEVPISYRAASPSVGLRTVADAVVNLVRLAWLRVRGRA